jgi:hypothetical protein
VLCIQKKNKELEASTVASMNSGFVTAALSHRTHLTKGQRDNWGDCLPSFCYVCDHQQPCDIQLIVRYRYEEEGVHHFQLLEDYVNQCVQLADLMMAADGKYAHHYLDGFVSIKRLLFHRHEFGLILLTGEFLLLMTLLEKIT